MLAGIGDLRTQRASPFYEPICKIALRQRAMNDTPEDLPCIQRNWVSPLLAFNNSSLERKYEEQFVNSAIDVSRGHSRVKTFMKVGPLAIFVVKNVTSSVGIVKSWPCAVRPALALVWSLYDFWTERVERGAARRWWVILAVLLKAVFMSVTATMALSVFDDEPFMGESCIWGCLDMTGIFTANFAAWAAPVLFKHHLWLHSLMVFAQMKLCAGRFCARLQKKALLRGHQELGHCAGPFSILYQILTTAQDLATPRDPLTGPPSPRTVCMGAILFLQLVLGWWLPTVLIYVSERSSRARFLLEQEGDHEEEMYMLKMERELEDAGGVLPWLSRTLMKVKNCCLSVVLLIDRKSVV